MRFGVLGPLTVHDGASALVIGQPKAKVLLASLLLQHDQVVASDDLKAALWGERPPATASSSLHNHLSRLRRALGEVAAGRLRAVPPGYVLEVGEGELDMDLHQAALDKARAAHRHQDWESVRRECAKALKLWRGRPLADVPALAEVMPYARRIQSLDESWLLAMELRCEAELRLGRHQGLAAELALLAAEHPLREASTGS
ncbi:winged helix-turn-helix domain-containing protein [Streptomyces sp. ISL-66]|uniref:AfsR/SARP family transcriptional regulator n=1 Tax=Streptomyces sp. ISL-66 TaxID=2819186 RepID=UPI001BE75F72|nr:BTAD domain-containing putative transcriptional regulator [Streptomyces sp. ISL-66]MBT2471294.1 winged helix-turn-helix domain-containing protein [Streptomyces sp. ISL-66]